jgi:hypothetical protein
MPRIATRCCRNWPDAQHRLCSALQNSSTSSRRNPSASQRPIVDDLVARIGYAEHIAAQVGTFLARAAHGNLRELVEWLRAMGRNGAGDLAAQLALLAHGDRDDPGNAVRLMTLHAAKGLEFRSVFLVGVDDATLPHEGSIEEGRIEEERRLLYVGITRAKENLSLSYAKRRKRFGEIIANQPSRFLKELPPDDIHWAGRDEERTPRTRKKWPRRISRGWPPCWRLTGKIDRIAAAWRRFLSSPTGRPALAEGAPWRGSFSSSPACAKSAGRSGSSTPKGSRGWPSVATAASMLVSIGLLGLAMKTLPVGTAYAIWVGIGAVGTLAFGMLFGEPATPLRWPARRSSSPGVGLKLAG